VSGYGVIKAFRDVKTAFSRVFSPRNFAAIAAVPALIAAAHFATYTVHRGDTLTSIAQRYCHNAGDWTGLWKASGIANPNVIETGQKIVLDCRYVHVPQPVRNPVRTVSSGGYDPAGDLTRAQVGQLWLNAGGPGWAEYAAEQVSWCESGWNTRAYNPSGASGLWQILGSVVPGYVFDARVNAANAVAKFRASGDTWAQWVCTP
jgi:LysM domain/Transglycosylase SLT domain